MDTIYIGLGHKKRVGKDTFGMYLSNAFHMAGRTADRRGFADKLKGVAYQLYGWAGLMPGKYYEENPEERNTIIKPLGKTVRQIWIDLGTPAIREQVYDRTWIDYLLNQPRTHDIVIIPDLRFPNEAEAIHAKGGLCIKVEMPSLPDTDDVADCALDGHNIWDYTVVNNGTKDLLREKADKLAREIMLRYER